VGPVPLTINFSRVDDSHPPIPRRAGVRRKALRFILALPASDFTRTMRKASGSRLQSSHLTFDGETLSESATSDQWTRPLRTSSPSGSYPSDSLFRTN